MSGRFLVDTNFVIAFINGDARAAEIMASADEVFFATVVLGELFYGAFKSNKQDENLSRIADFAANTTVLVCDTETSRQYGIVKNELRMKGRPIPENDVWIAAFACQHQLTLLTRDDHFAGVDRLVCESW